MNKEFGSIDRRKVRDFWVKSMEYDEKGLLEIVVSMTPESAVTKNGSDELMLDNLLVR